MKRNIQHPTPNIQRRAFTRFGLIGCWMFPAILFLIAALPLRGQTNASATNALPALLPPYGDLPPTFWEQHGTSIVIAGLGVIVLTAFGLWLVFRPKPKMIVPPEVQAREALQKLSQQPEDGAVLSRVSQVLRHYFIAAFELAPGELTTAEFSRLLSSCKKINPELSTVTTDFLRECDAQKFSATAGPAKFDAANQALNLVEQAEQRRTQLRQLAELQPQGPHA